VAVRLFIDNAIAFGVAIFIGVIWCKAGLKSLRRRISLDGFTPGQSSRHAAAADSSGAHSGGCGIS